MESKPLFNIVLHTPEIPGNTGSIGRTCLALNLRLILIKPYGFDLSEKAVRRAGLDYWKHVSITEYENWDDFLAKEAPANEKLHLFTKSAPKSYFDTHFEEDCYLIFGAESTGLPSEILDSFTQQQTSLPMHSEHIRSLNLSNVATAAAYEAYRQIR